MPFFADASWPGCLYCFDAKYLESISKTRNRCHTPIVDINVIPDGLDDDEIRSLSGALAVVRLFVDTKNLTGLLQIIAKGMFGDIN